MRRIIVVWILTFVIFAPTLVIGQTPSIPAKVASPAPSPARPFDTSKIIPPEFQQFFEAQIVARFLHGFVDKNFIMVWGGMLRYQILDKQLNAALPKEIALMRFNEQLSADRNHFEAGEFLPFVIDGRPLQEFLGSGAVFHIMDVKHAPLSPTAAKIFVKVEYPDALKAPPESLKLELTGEGLNMRWVPANDKKLRYMVFSISTLNGFVTDDYPSRLRDVELYW